MTLVEDIYKNCGDDATLYALVNLRIYPDTIPDDAVLPALSHLSISAAPEYPISGSTINGWLERIQFDIVAADSDKRDAIRAALIVVLLGFVGYTVAIHDKGILNTFNIYDPESTDHRCTLEWQVLYA